MGNLNSFFVVLPHDLFVSKVPNGEKEFFCYLSIPQLRIDQEKRFSWRLVSSKNGDNFVNGERLITEQENKRDHEISISTILPREFESGKLTVKLASYQQTWQIQSYNQKDKFRLPLEGQVLVVVGHRIGETHRSAHKIPSQQFGWDLLPLHNDGLRLLRRPFSEHLESQDFEAFGLPVLAPASGLIVKAVDGIADLVHVGELPTNLDYFLEDFTRASGNYVIIDHGNGVWSCLAHLKNGSVQVKGGQQVEVSEKLGELGNSGFSSGPHVHLQFMNGPDILSASPLPVELDLEGGTYAPQAGEITSSL